ncbi:hypothetical protein CH302_19270 [Rhodococcus sp. 15-2388-1-1a]|uniref:HNH endonuclease n=1 Tax=Nocardiaceae TaxID=85025 RepID=UPI000690A0CA|nr:MULTISPECIES: HNH endonuclease [Rhodococcus]OZE95082.1 hypothetical protein CH302_19270 [Rhodococcus sp. 15-2388-1-1a]
MSNGTCSIAECTTPAKTRGWCEMHYTRWRRHGDTAATLRSREDTVAAVLTHHMKGDAPETGCWLWPHTIADTGYGTFVHAGTRYGAHRVSHEAFNGPIPDGMCVRHTCDVRACINPAHLIVGTQAENIGDMVERDRQCTGMRNGQAKLTDAQIADIRRRYALGGITQYQLADEYSVRQPAISRIVRGLRWKKQPMSA